MLKALYNMFDESPAKREDYRNITKSDVFPLPFLDIDQLKTKKVAEIALKIWPNITNFVSETFMKPKGKMSDSFS